MNPINPIAKVVYTFFLVFIAISFAHTTIVTPNQQTQGMMPYLKKELVETVVIQRENFMGEIVGNDKFTAIQKTELYCF